MASKIIIRTKTREDDEAVAALIRDSLNVWYKRNRGFDDVVPSLEAASIYTRVYDALDPECCFVAEDAENGKLAGSCFYHPRPTHASLGLMTVAPEYFGCKAASKLVARIADLARQRNQPLRLVSSAMNLDSFSLYNRAGFVPTALYQDMSIPTPEGGFEPTTPPGTRLRDASLSDVDALVALERELCGIDRAKDFRFFIENASGIWGSSVVEENGSGAILGAMFSVCDPGCKMVGPGFAREEDYAYALIVRELNRYAGRWSPIVLAPCRATTLRMRLYELGARNTELHVAQTLGEILPQRGAIVPTFMPESA